MLDLLFTLILFLNTQVEMRPVIYSYYQAVPEQTDYDPSVSACGPTLEPWRQVAIHRDLKSIYPCGTMVLSYSEEFGFNLFVVNDVTARHISPERWDVLVDVNEDAMEYGLDQGWVLSILPLDLMATK